MPDPGGHGRYRPLLELGRGSRSRICLAESLTAGLQKLVVLKLLHPELCQDPEARAAFQREAALSAHLNHPNTVYVFEVGEHEGLPMIVMEYLEGVPLTRILSHCGYRLSLAARVFILGQVLAGLHHLHELSDLQGNPLRALHRDVSPHNVIVLHEGGVKLVGFGAATTAEHHDARAVGNIQYMAPELLFQGVAQDRRADVYAAGVMLWEALARRPLWKDYDRPAIAHALARGDLPSLSALAPDAPRELARVAIRALSRNPDARYASAQLMQEALERAARATAGVGHVRDLVALLESSFGGEQRRRRQQIAEARRAPPQASLARSEAPPNAASEMRIFERLARPRPRRALLAACAAAVLATWIGVRGAPGRGRERAPVRAAIPQTAPARIAAEPIPAQAHVDRDRAASSRDRVSPQAPLPRARESAAEPPRTWPADELATPAPRSAPRAPARDCHPPFRLTEDGVKAFKPECFVGSSEAQGASEREDL